MFALDPEWNVLGGEQSVVVGHFGTVIFPISTGHILSHGVRKTHRILMMLMILGMPVLGESS